MVAQVGFEVGTALLVVILFAGGYYRHVRTQDVSGEAARLRYLRKVKSPLRRREVDGDQED